MTDVFAPAFSAEAAEALALLEGVPPVHVDGKLVPPAEIANALRWLTPECLDALRSIPSADDRAFALGHAAGQAAVLLRSLGKGVRLATQEATRLAEQVPKVSSFDILPADPDELAKVVARKHPGWKLVHMRRGGDEVQFCGAALLLLRDFDGLGANFTFDGDPVTRLEGATALLFARQTCDIGGIMATLADNAQRMAFLRQLVGQTVGVRRMLADAQAQIRAAWPVESRWWLGSVIPDVLAHSARDRFADYFMGQVKQ